MSSRSSIFLVLLALLLVVAPVQGQSVEFRLDVNRDFGYGNGADVGGNFSMTIYGDQDAIAAVTYFIDGNEMGRFSEPPYQVKFRTGDYPSGWHTLTAVVETRDGRSVSTPEVRLNFLSAEQQTQSMQKIFIPLVGGLLVLTLVGAGSQFLLARGSQKVAPGTPRNYGMFGGAICPRCGRPFARHVWGINLVTGKLDRCDHCGKWFLARRRSPAELAAAERAELEAARAAESGSIGNASESEEERLRKLLDESRYSSGK